MPIGISTGSRHIARMASQAQLSTPARGGAAARPAAISKWLLLVALLVFAMVVVVAITRLTESWVPMLRCVPVSLAVPPISREAS